MANVIRGNSLYAVVNGPSWKSAEANSTTLGGHLFTVSNENENIWIGKEFSDSKYEYPEDNAPWAPSEYSINHYWSGGQLINGSWQWVSGEVFDKNLSSLYLNNYLTDSTHDKLMGIFNNPNHWSNIYLDDSKDTYPVNPGVPIKGIAEIPLNLSITRQGSAKESAGVFTTSINLSAGTQTSGNLAEGATVYWKLTGITADDLASGALSGSGTISNGKLDFQNSLKIDSDKGEQLEVSVYSDTAMTLQIGSTDSVAVQEAPVIRGNSLYTIVYGPSWTQAEANSVRLGGHLVTINDRLETDYLVDKLEFTKVGLDSVKPKTDPTYDQYWIGLSRKQGDWSWISGDQSTYRYFGPKEPFNGQPVAAMNVFPQGTYSGDWWGAVSGSWVDSLDSGNSAYGRFGIAETPFIRRGDSAYVIIQGPTWEEAEANAVKLGGHLVTINDAAENDWLVQNGFTNQPKWVGLTDKRLEGTWEWSDNNTFTYNNWTGGQPDNSTASNTNEGQDYGVIGVNGKWDDGENPLWAGISPLNGIAEIKLAPNNQPTGTPSITGTLKGGSTLTIDASSIQDADNFTGYTPTYQYNWEVSSDNGTTWSKITSTDATDNNTTYTLTAAEVGKQVRGVVRYLDGYGTNEVLKSSPVNTSAQIVSTDWIKEIKSTLRQSFSNTNATFSIDIQGLQSDGNGNAYICGNAFSLLPGAPAGAARSSHGSFIAKITPAGTVEWKNTINNPDIYISSAHYEAPFSVTKSGLIGIALNNRANSSYTFETLNSDGEKRYSYTGNGTTEGLTGGSWAQEGTHAEILEDGSSYFIAGGTGNTAKDKLFFFDNNGALKWGVDCSDGKFIAQDMTAVPGGGIALAGSYASQNQGGVKIYNMQGILVKEVKTNGVVSSVDFSGDGSFRLAGGRSEGYKQFIQSYSASGELIWDKEYPAKYSGRGIDWGFLKISSFDSNTYLAVTGFGNTTLINKSGSIEWDSGDQPEMPVTNGLVAGSNGIYFVRADQLVHVEDPRNIYKPLAETDENIPPISSPQAPTNLSLSALSFLENNGSPPYGNSIATSVGRFSTTDPNPGDSFSYSFIAGSGATDNARFFLDGNQLKFYGSADYETQNTFSIRVRSTDSSGLSIDQSFSINVLNMPEPGQLYTSYDLRESQFNQPIEGSTLKVDSILDLDEVVGTPTYSWFKNNTLVQSSTSPTYTVPLTGTGGYRVDASYLDGTGAIDTATHYFSMVYAINNGGGTLSAITAAQSAAFQEGVTLLAGSVSNDPDGPANTSSFRYQWLLNNQPIAAATASSYTTPATANGSYTLQLTYTDEQGFDNVVFSAPQAIGIVNNGVGTASPLTPSLPGTFQEGVTLSAGSISNDPDGAATINSYQWYRNNQPIAGATSSTTTVGPTAAGTYKVAISYTDAQGFSSTVESPDQLISTSNNGAATASAISSSTPDLFREGVTLSAGSLSADPDGNGPITAYQWYRNGKAIAGATNSTTTVGPQGAGSYKVAISYSDAQGFSSTVESPEQLITASNNGAGIASPITTENGAPLLPGVRLLAGTIGSDPDGDATITAYQWFFNDIAISGAISSRYTTPINGAGNYKVAISYTDAQGFSSTVESPDQLISPGINRNGVASAITSSTTNSFQEGVTLTAGSISGDPDGNGSITAYQWYRNNQPISGATNASYITSTTGSGTYKVAISYRDGAGNIATVDSPDQLISAINNGTATANPFSSSTPGLFQEGVTLIAGTVSNDPDGAATINAYQWYRNNQPIAGATNATYSVGATATGSYKLSTSYTDAQGFSATVDSPEQLISAINNGTATANPFSSSTPGLFQEGVTLSAGTVTGDPDGAATITGYQWYRNNLPIAGANSSTYSVGATATGTYKLSTSYTDAQGFSATVDSPEQLISAINNGTATATAFSSSTPGLFQEGVTLSAGTVTGDPDGAATITGYQWYRNNQPIAGANSSTYSVGPIASGTYKLSTSYTDAQGFSATIDSADQLISAINNGTATATPFSSSTPGLYQEGVTLIAGSLTSDPDGIGAVTGYQWYRNNLPVAGANSSAYSIGATAAGSYRLSTSYTDAQGFSATVDSAEQLVSAVNNGTATATAFSSSTPGLFQEGVTLIAGSLTSDPDGPATINGYQWYRNNQPIAGANSSAYLTPTGSAGTYKLATSYTDAQGFSTTVESPEQILSAISTPTPTPTPTPNPTPGKNIAPTLGAPLSAQTLVINQPFSYTIPAATFQDPDSTLSIALSRNDGTSLPDWMTYNAATSTLSGTPTARTSLQLKVTASDELSSVATPLTLNVREGQILSSSAQPIRYQYKKDVVVPVNYATTDQAASTGLSFRVHFNSSLFSFDTLTGAGNKISADIFQVGAIQSDATNLDNDSATDKYFPVNIVSLSGLLPGGNNGSPVKLTDLTFKATDLTIDPLTGQGNPKINFSLIEAAQGYGFLASSATLAPPSFSLDVDGDGKITALGDGLMVIRKLFGASFAGDALTSKAISPTATRTTAQIHDFIQQGIDNGFLDVDKDGKTTALGDGLMVIRRLFGASFAGSALTNKAISPDSPLLGGKDYSGLTTTEKDNIAAMVGFNIDALYRQSNV